MIIQTGTGFLEILRKAPVTGGQTEHTIRFPCRLPCHVTAHIGSQIVTGFLLVFFHRQSGIRLIGKAEIGVALVILQKDVVLRLVLFDETALQHKGFVFRVGDNKIVVIHVFDHTGDLRRMVGRLPKITCHTIFQILCFSHVDDLRLLIFHQINTRRCCELCCFLP